MMGNMVLFFRQLETLPGDDHGADGDRTVGDVKDRPDAKIDKIDHVPVHDPVEQIPHRPSQNQRKGDHVTSVEDFIVLAIIINVENQKGNRDDGNDDEDNALVAEKAESDAGIVNEGRVKNVRNKG